MDSIQKSAGREQEPEDLKVQKPQERQALTRGGRLRQVQVGESGKPRVSKDPVNVEFQPLGKRNLSLSEGAWERVEACVKAIGVSKADWKALGSRDQRAEVLIDVIEVRVAEEGLDNEFATVMLEALSALTCALQVDGERNAELQELNLARSVTLASDLVKDFGDEMDPVQTGLMLQAASNIYTNKSADASHCRRGAELLQNIADRCDLAEGSNQRAALIDMLESPPSRLKKDPDFLKAHAQAIGTASAALYGLTGEEAKSLFKGIQTISNRSTDPEVREYCLEALQDLESFVEPQGMLLRSIQKLEAKLEKQLR